MEPQERVKGLSEMCFTVSKWDGRAGAGNKHTDCECLAVINLTWLCLLMAGVYDASCM